MLVLEVGVLLLLLITIEIGWGAVTRHQITVRGLEGLIHLLAVRVIRVLIGLTSLILLVGLGGFR